MRVAPGESVLLIQTGHKEEVTRPSGPSVKALIEYGTLAITTLGVFGYLSWALYAESLGLGAPPIFRAQYFGGGVFPALLCIALFLGLRQVSRIWASFTPVHVRNTRWGPRLLGASLLLEPESAIWISVEPRLLVRSRYGLP
jgi:hypothetical protein